jgi:chromosomal replication initiator protein
LGKTHLLHAIGHSVYQNHPSVKLIYISTEEFTNEFIRALRLERTQEFRERYRTVDLLLIDDIHMLAGKNQTQEEFFHTFNALYEHQKQVVLASDLLPREIQGLRERLHSRFHGGLIADIQPPDVETKVAILHKKAQLTKEGCLNRMLAMQSSTGRPVNIHLAKDVLKPLIKTEDRVITPLIIMETVADYYQLKVADLKSKNNSNCAAPPDRHVSLQTTDRLLAPGNR